MSSKASKLYSCVDHSPESGAVFKTVLWSDDFIEIVSKQPTTNRSKIFRVSTGLVSAMIQRFSHNLEELWKELCGCVQFYSDSILFSTQHILYFPLSRDGDGRSTQKIYEISKIIEHESDEMWKIEYFANIESPLDLEIAVSIPKLMGRKLFYRVEGTLLKPYFEKYCLELYAKSKRSVTTDFNVTAVSQNTDEENEANGIVQQNFMLEAIAEELLYDEEADKILVKSIDLMKLQDYLDTSLTKYTLKNNFSGQNDAFSDDDNDEGSDRFSRSQMSPITSPEHHFIKITDSSVPQYVSMSVMLDNIQLSPRGGGDEDMHSVYTTTDRSQLVALTLGDLPSHRPPPVDKFEPNIHQKELNYNYHHGDLQRNLAAHTSKIEPIDDIMDLPKVSYPHFSPMNPDRARFSATESEREREKEAVNASTSVAHRNTLSHPINPVGLSPLMAKIAKDMNVGRIREYIDVSELIGQSHGSGVENSAPEDIHGHGNDNNGEVALILDPIIQTGKDCKEDEKHVTITLDINAAPKLTVTQQLALLEKQPAAVYSPRKKLLRSSMDLGLPSENDNEKAEEEAAVATKSNRLIATRRSRSNNGGNTNATANDARAQLRKEFLQSNVAKSVFNYESNIEEVQEQISQMIEGNKILILKAKQEADLLMRSPLNQQGAMLLNKTQSVQASTHHSGGISNDVKLSIVREALSIRSDLRSAMSTKTIIEFLQSQCPALSTHIKLSSWDDMVAISNDATLVEVRKIDPTVTKAEENEAKGIERTTAGLRMESGKSPELTSILGIRNGQLITSLYIVVNGSITVEWEEEDEEAKLQDLFRNRGDNNEDDEEDDEDEDDDDGDDEEEEDEENDGYHNSHSRNHSSSSQSGSHQQRKQSNPPVIDHKITEKSNPLLPSFLRKPDSKAKLTNVDQSSASRHPIIGNLLIKHSNDDEDDDSNAEDSKEAEDNDELHTLPPDNDQSTAITTIRTVETPIATIAKRQSKLNLNSSSNNTSNPWGVPNPLQKQQSSRLAVEDIVTSAKKKQKPRYALDKTDRSYRSQDPSTGKDTQYSQHFSNKSQQIGKQHEQYGHNEHHFHQQQQNTTRKMITRRLILTPGDIIGENVFRGEYLYRYDIIQYSPDAMVCQIPVIAFEHFVGRSGKDVEEYLVHFWKRLRLWILIKEYNKALVQQNLYEIKFKQIMGNNNPAGGNNNRRDNHNKIQVMNVIDSGRIRTYHAGEVVFEQDTPRHYIYIIKQGMATYYREFKQKPLIVTSTMSDENNKNKEKGQEASWLKDIIPPRVETTVFYNALDDSLKKKGFPPSKVSTRPTSSGYGQRISSIHGISSLKNNDSNNAKVDPWEEPRVNSGVEDHGGGILLTHDFSFLDSEEADIFLPLMAKMDSKFLGSLSKEGEENEEDEEGEMLLSPDAVRAKKMKKQLDALYQESERAQEYRRQKYARFGRHQNTLVATTRCEICVIQLSEIVKCYPLFQTLFKLANDRYPGLLVSNDEVVRNYHHQQEWLRQKPTILKDVAEEQLNKLLYEEIHHELGNYENETVYESRKPGLQHMRIQGKMASVLQRQLELLEDEEEKSQLLDYSKKKVDENTRTHTRDSSEMRPVSPTQGPTISGPIPSSPPIGSQLSSKFSSPAKSLITAHSSMTTRPKSASAATRTRRTSANTHSSNASSNTRDVSDAVDGSKPMEFGYKQVLNDAIRLYGVRKRTRSPENRLASASMSTRGSANIDRSLGYSQDSAYLVPRTISDDTISFSRGRADSASSYLSNDAGNNSDANTVGSGGFPKASTKKIENLERIHEEEKERQPLKIDPAWIAFAAKQHGVQINGNQLRPYTAVPAPPTSSLSQRHTSQKKKSNSQIHFAPEIPQELKMLSEMDFNSEPSSSKPTTTIASNMTKSIDQLQEHSLSTTGNGKKNPKQAKSTSIRPFSANSSSSATAQSKHFADVERLPATYMSDVGPPVLKASIQQQNTAAGDAAGTTSIPQRPSQFRPSSASASIRGTSRRTFMKQQQEEQSQVPAPITVIDPLTGISSSVTSTTANSNNNDNNNNNNIVKSRPSSAASGGSIKLRPEDYAELYRAHASGALGGAGQQHQDLSTNLAALRAQDRAKVEQLRQRHATLIAQQEQYDLRKLASASRAEESDNDDDDGEEPEDTATTHSKRSSKSNQSRGSSRASVSVFSHSNNNSSRSSSVTTRTSLSSKETRGSVKLRPNITGKEEVSTTKKSENTTSTSSDMMPSAAPKYLDDFFRRLKA